MNPKVLILRTAGTNCDRETAFAFTAAGGQVHLRHLNEVKDKRKLAQYQIICFPGGFSYGDDLGAGKILSLELSLWLRAELEKFIAGGGLILGVCNGFQVLVKTGILPDLDFQQKVTLTFNDSGRFEDRWVYLKTKDQRPKTKDTRPATKDQKVDRVGAEGIWLRGLPAVITLPVAHGEGKFYAERGILDKIEKNNQAVLKYADRHGGPAQFPFNPNGALDDIAGITSLDGRVLGLMPHPERFVFKEQWPFWPREACPPFGLQIFKNAVGYFK